MAKTKTVEYITITEVARRTSTSRDIAQYWVDAGLMESVRFPGRGSRDIRRVTLESYEKFCDTFKEQKPQPRRRKRK